MWLPWRLEGVDLHHLPGCVVMSECLCKIGALHAVEPKCVPTIHDESAEWGYFWHLWGHFCLYWCLRGRDNSNLGSFVENSSFCNEYCTNDRDFGFIRKILINRIDLSHFWSLGKCPLSNANFYGYFHAEFGLVWQDRLPGYLAFSITPQCGMSKMPRGKFGEMHVRTVERTITFFIICLHYCILRDSDDSEQTEPVTICYRLLPSATVCYCLLPSVTKPVTICYRLLPSVTICYHLLWCVTIAGNKSW
jgi:hypothetical protein